MRLDGEVAIVTGSTAGLGVEIARLFAAEGASVVVTGRHAQRGEHIAQRLRDDGGRCEFIAADLADDADRDRLVARTVERFGTVSILVNNAVNPQAIASDGPVTETPLDIWSDMFQVNVLAVASLCQQTIPVMVERGGGSIVNISSRAAQVGTPGLAAYSASKGALNALTRSISIDYARHGVRCNTVQPGYIINEHRDADASDEYLQRVRDMHLTRLATATDVAYAVLFLASREAEVITGVTLQVDGGSTAARGRTLG